MESSGCLKKKMAGQRGGREGCRRSRRGWSLGPDAAPRSQHGPATRMHLPAFQESDRKIWKDCD